MLKKILAVILAVLIATGVAITCIVIFAPKTIEVVAVNATLESDDARGEYYELTAEWSYKFTAKTKTKYNDVYGEYETVLAGSAEKMYFLEVKEGQESVHALSMSDLALNFLSANVKGEEVTVRTSAAYPLSGYEFEKGDKALKYSKDYIDDIEYTVFDGEEQKTMLGANIKAQNAEREKSAHYTLTINDVVNNVSETVVFWVVPGVNIVTLSTHRLTF